MSVFICIDDTDNMESIGTGRLSRMLAEELTKKGLVSNTSVTRHQLLVHPDIPYTSHNSSACIEGIPTNGDLHKIAECAQGFLLQNFHEGADPGLCVSEKDAVPEDLRTFGMRAQKEVLTMEEAREIADRLGVYIWLGGGTGQGFIGAMAGVGLRSTGNDGRFIELKGIREVKGVKSVGDILSQTAISRVINLLGEALPDYELIDTQNWIRPNLHHKEIVFFVQKEGTLWRSPEKKKPKNKD
ncbi:MAG: hypothetical protein OS130_00690 [Thermodesulfobacteriota bacterium]|jgi:hypothetical protein|nr:MAG: hypothetical protein OS130_00690 [Thermodesulfobacteriota bacterium]